MATKAEVRDQALELLGVLRIGQSPQDQDKVTIETAYDEVYADLKKDGLATWSSTGSVPAELVPHVAHLVAFARIDVYGVSNERYQRILAKTGENGWIAKREIRRLTTPDYESLEEPTDY